MVIFNKLPTFYATGTATVAANATAVTGTGTDWTALQPGDLFGVHKGLAVPISEVVSATELTLQYPWPGAAQTNAAYCVQLVPRSVGVQEATRQLLLMLANGNLGSFAGIAGETDALPIFTGAGALTKILPAALLAKMGIVPNAQLPTRLRELSTAVTDADVAVTTGSYAVTSTALNIPEGGAGVLTVDMFSSNSGAVQIYTRLSNGNMWVRVRNAGAWGAWARVPTFGSDNIIPEASLPARARAASSSVTNIDTAVDSGDYTAAGTATGHPTGSGVFGFSTVYVNLTTQIQIGSTAGNAWYVRAKSSGTWGSWSRLPLAQTSVTDTTANAAMIVGAFGLGANSITLSSSDNLDNLTASSGMYNWGSPSPTNAPYTFGGLLNIRRNPTTGIQVVWNHGTGSPQYRYQGSGTWSAWISFGGDVSGPAAAIDNAPVGFSGTSGKTIKQLTGPVAALHAVTGAANKLAYFTGAAAMATTDLSAFARTILDDADGAAMFATMGATRTGNSSSWVATFPNGLKVQGGRSSHSIGTADAPISYTWPSAFSSVCFGAFVQAASHSSNVICGVEEDGLANASGFAKHLTTANTVSFKWLGFGY